MGGALASLTTFTRPIIGTTDILIRVKAVAINPADVKMIDQGHRVQSWPLVPGLDGAGVIEDMGRDVKGFERGDHVLALFVAGDEAASFQSLARVPERAVAKVPASWSLEDAATLGRATDRHDATFSSGSGGSSAVGAATIQLLRRALPGCKILTTSSPKHHAHLRNTLGADTALDRGSTTLARDVRSATPGCRGVDAIVDTVGAGAAQQDIFQALNPRGPQRYAQVWTGAAEIEAPPEVDSVLFRGRDLPQLPGHENIMFTLQSLLEEQKYQLPLPVRHVGHGLTALQRGLELMRDGVSGEKLVATI
ncbi:hypothetical protein N7492_004170 [Penicillium capsulatum]|uniref:Enoyl reductase (ER) domain-containing protein n=1 Tax=Penicillium capsulatum TaxID=69766 RepID=A0A9W9IPZ6_9EURO|nr:hypothetical protein N7492_004170 [Penicillium capsulatum]